jgi:hypothetical protein
VDGQQTTVDWFPVVPRKGFRRERPQSATILNLSLTGALVRARTDSRIVRGTRVEIGTPAGRGVAGVRRIRPIDEQWSDYGIQFVSLDSGLQKFIEEACAADRPNELDWRRS